MFNFGRRLGSRLYKLYDKHPIVMNCVVGGVVYFAGECVAETNIISEPPKFLIEGKPLSAFTDHELFEKFVDGEEFEEAVEGVEGGTDLFKKYSDRVDLNRASQVGLLGMLENGVLMLLWYKLLKRVVGASGATSVVLIKCLLDQIFFATQQDGIFLAYCAYLNNPELSAVWQEVSDNFVTTWLNDCALWPIVNFIGFAYVPYKFQPTYMSAVQFFWQIYISSVAVPVDDAADETEVEPLTSLKSLQLMPMALPASLIAASAIAAPIDSVLEVTPVTSTFAADSLPSAIAAVATANAVPSNLSLRPHSAMLSTKKVAPVHQTHVQLRKGLKIVCDRIKTANVDSKRHPGGLALPFMFEELPALATGRSYDEEEERALAAAAAEKEAALLKLERLQDREQAIFNAQVSMTLLAILSVVRKVVFKV